jgi:type IV pilus assembly protein PilN
MRIGINLASRPYQDEGRFYRLWGAALAAMILLTAALLMLSVRHYRNAGDEWANARTAEDKLAELRKEEVQAQQILAQPQNRGTRDTSQFLNTAILRKSFSWTRLMEDMEKVMPAGLHVVSIAPVIDQQNHFVLKVQVEGPRRESAIELLRNMEKSQHFRSSQLVSETQMRGNKKSTGGVRSDIRTSYLPAEPLEGEGE